MKGMSGMQWRRKGEGPGCYPLMRMFKATALVFILVITTHWLDQKHFSTVQQTSGVRHTLSGSKGSLLLDDLRRKHLGLFELETSLLQGKDAAFERAWFQMHASLDSILSTLDSLAAARPGEYAPLLAAKKESSHTSHLLLKVEMAFLIILGIIIQVVILHPWRPWLGS